MKNKKNIYFLALAVLIIWGLLGYRIYTATQPQKSGTQLTVLNNNFKPNDFKETAPFSIKADYRDPFLGSTTIKKSKPRPKAVVASKPKTPFPSIIYKGLVTGANNNQVFIISIDGKQYFFKKYQTHQKVKLVNGNTQSIAVAFERQRQSFQLEK